MRLFIALDVPEETRRALHCSIAEFSKVCRGARWVRAESVHITLKFIGYADDASLSPIQQALSYVHAPQQIDIAFRKFGFFPNESHPKVFFVGIEPLEKLRVLADKIEARLEPLGIAKETRAFQPHLTLARFKTKEGLPDLRRTIASLPSRDFGGVKADEFYLYQSVLNSDGAMYTKLSSYRFVK